MNTNHLMLSSRASSTASADQLPLPASVSRSASTGGNSSRQGTTRAYKSNFKRALKRVEVPPVLQQGIPVIRVYANGKTPKQQYLTLSSDKFTLYITSTPMHSRHSKSGSQRRSGGSWFSNASASLLPSVLRRNSSVDSVSSSVKQANLSDTAEGSRRRANKEIRAIDIGAIHRIQRGAHNANLKTTTTSAATVQNLSRRSRSDLLK